MTSEKHTLARSPVEAISVCRDRAPGIAEAVAAAHPQDRTTGFAPGELRGALSGGASAARRGPNLHP